MGHYGFLDMQKILLPTFKLIDNYNPNPDEPEKLEVN
jgi:hypothetical protein